MTQARLLVERALAASGGARLLVEVDDPKQAILDYSRRCITCGSAETDEYVHRNQWGNFPGRKCYDCGQFWTPPHDSYGYPNGLQSEPECEATLEYNRKMREQMQRQFPAKPPPTPGVQKAMPTDIQAWVDRRQQETETLVDVPRVRIVEVDPKADVLYYADPELVLREFGYRQIGPDAWEYDEEYHAIVNLTRDNGRFSIMVYGKKDALGALYGMFPELRERLVHLENLVKEGKFNESEDPKSELLFYSDPARLLERFGFRDLGVLGGAHAWRMDSPPNWLVIRFDSKRPDLFELQVYDSHKESRWGDDKGQYLTYKAKYRLIQLEQVLRSWCGEVTEWPKPFTEAFDPKEMVLAASPELIGRQVADEAVAALRHHYQTWGGRRHWFFPFANGDGEVRVRTHGHSVYSTKPTRPIHIEVWHKVPWQSGVMKNVYNSTVHPRAPVLERERSFIQVVGDRVLKGVRLAMAALNNLTAVKELHDLNQQMMVHPEWTEHAGTVAEREHLPVGYEQQTLETMERWRELMRAFAKEKGMDVQGL